MESLTGLVPEAGLEPALPEGKDIRAWQKRRRINVSAPRPKPDVRRTQ
jgi:hypothetical protein